VGRLENPRTLGRLAMEEKDERVRARATGRLNDRTLLARILREDPSPLVRREAVARVGDPGALRSALEDPDGAVRARAVLELPDEPALFQDLVMKDPSPLVRKNACGRLLDPAILSRVIRTDASASVRSAAMGRLTDPETLEAYLSDGSDWKLRKQAALQMSDPAVLERVALTDADEDVRRAACKRLLDLRTVGRVADPGLRERIWRDLAHPVRPLVRADLHPPDGPLGGRVAEVLEFQDHTALQKAFAEGPAPIRRAVAFRMLELDGQVTDHRLVRLMEALLDPAVQERLGPLSVDATLRFDERRYSQERPEGGYPPLRGRTRVEQWVVRVVGSDGKPVLDREFRGAKAGKVQVFDEHYPRLDDYYLRYNAADFDFEAIAAALIEPGGPELWKALAGGVDKYLRSAADALLQP